MQPELTPDWRQTMPDHEPLNAEPSVPASAPPAGDEPMTPRLMARLFVVPLLIVVMIVFSSAAVVLLFGWISESQEQSVEVLVERIKSGVGNLVLGVAMLPEDREVWQAASDLARRLQSDDPRDLPVEKRPVVAAQLADVLVKTRGVRQTPMGQEMQRFILTALGRLAEAGQVGLITDYATDDNVPTDVRKHAVGVLIESRTRNEAMTRATRDAWPRLAPLIDSPEVVLRIHAVMAVGALAEAGDAGAIGLLTRAYHGNNREVVWNATLALARLHSPVCIPQLLDMLSRAEWEKVRVEVPERPGQEGPKLPPARVDEYLKVSIDAARMLGDERLREAVHKLTADSSLQVKDHARRALEKWPQSATGPASVN